MNFLVSSETSKLKSVIIGIANSNGKTPHIDDLYDPKSIENLKKGTYPKESDMVLELQSFVDVLQKHNVTVYRPRLINNYNQIFTRDVGFVIDNFFFKSNILPKRAKEFQAIDSILSNFNNKIINMKKVYYGKAVYNSKEINAVIKVLKNDSLSLVDGKNVKKRN